MQSTASAMSPLADHRRVNTLAHNIGTGGLKWGFVLTVEERNAIVGEVNNLTERLANAEKLLRERNQSRALECHVCGLPVSYNGEHGGGKFCP